MEDPGGGVPKGQKALRRRRVALGVPILVAAAIGICGCGAQTNATATREPPVGPPARRADEGRVQERGIKGESPSAEAASGAHISTADCARLAAASEGLLGRPLSRRSSPHPPSSRCSLSGRGASIEVYLDAGFAAHQRYYNRIEETVQLGETDPAKNPHPVPHVGERSIDDSAASWIPALGSLLAVRGNRWLTVTIAVARRPDRQLRDDAAALARLGFRITSG
jgi:hypothetical protein